MNNRQLSRTRKYNNNHFIIASTAYFQQLVLGKWRCFCHPVCYHCGPCQDVVFWNVGLTFGHGVPPLYHFVVRVFCMYPLIMFFVLSVDHLILCLVLFCLPSVLFVSGCNTWLLSCSGRAKKHMGNDTPMRHRNLAVWLWSLFKWFCSLFEYWRGPCWIMSGTYFMFASMGV